MNKLTSWVSGALLWHQVCFNTVFAVGVFIGYVEFKEAQKINKQRIAIEALSHARSKEFLDAFMRLKRGAESGELAYNGVEFDITYVMSEFEHIAMLYLYDLADRCIIKTSIEPTGSEVLGILGSLSKPYPKESRLYFDLLMGRLTEQI